MRVLRSSINYFTSLLSTKCLAMLSCTDVPIGRDNANDEGNEPLYRVYKVGPVKLYTVESILRL